MTCLKDIEEKAYNYIIVGTKDGVVYYWCYDYSTEHSAKGAFLTRAKVREKLKEFDTVEVKKVDFYLFGKSAMWRTKANVVKWLYKDYLHWKKSYDDWNDPADGKRFWQRLAYNKYQYAQEVLEG